jgi:hypothetical protein
LQPDKNGRVHKRGEHPTTQFFIENKEKLKNTIDKMNYGDENSSTTFGWEGPD